MAVVYTMAGASVQDAADCGHFPGDAAAVDSTASCKV